jgi:hypothetical protein
MVRVTILRAAAVFSPLLLACVVAHAQQQPTPSSSQSPLSSITDWLRGPPPQKPRLTVDAGVSPHPRAELLLPRPRPRPRPAELAPTSDPPDISRAGFGSPHDAGKAFGDWDQNKTAGDQPAAAVLFSAGRSR